MTTTSDPAAPPVVLTVEVVGRELHIAVCGELDLACAAVFDRLFDVDARGVDRVVLHLGAMTFCDITGLNALNGLREHHECEGRTVDVVDEQPQVRRLRALVERVPLAPPRGTAPA